MRLDTPSDPSKSCASASSREVIAGAPALRPPSTILDAAMSSRSFASPARRPSAARRQLRPAARRAAPSTAPASSASAPRSSLAQEGQRVDPAQRRDGAARRGSSVRQGAFPASASSAGAPFEEAGRRLLAISASRTSGRRRQQEGAVWISPRAAPSDHKPDRRVRDRAAFLIGCGEAAADTGRSRSTSS